MKWVVWNYYPWGMIKSNIMFELGKSKTLGSKQKLHENGVRTMKFKHILFLASLLIALPVSTMGTTAYRDFGPLELDTRGFLTVTGYVYDAFNHRPISNAQVTLTGTGGHSAMSQTDNNGFYRFTGLVAADYPPSGSIISVTHMGYWDADPLAMLPNFRPVIQIHSKTVVLVHGFGGSFDGTWGGNSGVFAAKLDSVGFKVVGVDVGGFPGNILPVSYAEGKMKESLQTQCMDQGIQSFDIVAHSMGGLVSRSYLTKPYGRDRINKLVMLATPNHGSFLASEALATSWMLDKVIEWVSGGLCCYGAINYVANQTALKDLAPGSAFLNTLNYNSTFNWGELIPCKSQFDENSSNGLATLYSIAGTHPTGWYNGGRALLGCWWTPSDGVVLKNRSFYQNGFTCTDDGFGCTVHHKASSVGIAKSPCIAHNVVRLLHDGIFDCNPVKESPLEGGGVLARLPVLVGAVEPEGSFQDSTLINAGSMVDFLCICGADSLVYSLESPSGQLINPDVCATDPNMEFVSDSYSAYYSIQYPESGQWKHFVSTVGSSQPDSLHILTSFDGDVSLSVSTESGIAPDADFTLEAVFTNAGIAMATGVVTAEVARPNGAGDSVELFDDGLGDDPIAGDGTYTAKYPAGGETGDFGFSFTAVTDPGSPAAESRAASVVSSAMLLPDLALTGSGLVVDNDKPPLGSILNMSAGFTNSGVATADSVLIQISNVSYGVILADSLVLGMLPGQSVQLDAEWLAAAEGDFALRAEAFLLGDGVEASSANNTSDITVTVLSHGAVSSVGGEERPGGGTQDGASSQIYLYNNYPNPVQAGGTSIRFLVPADGTQTELAIFDIRGRRVRTIISESLAQGDYQRIWDGRDNAGQQVASGVYFYRLQVAGQVQIKKLVVLR